MYSSKLSQIIIGVLITVGCGRQSLTYRGPASSNDSLLESTASTSKVTGVSGTLAPGHSITVSGSGFGTHANHSTADTSIISAGWNDFETGRLANGNFRAPVADPQWTVETTNNRGRSQYHAKKVYIDHRGGEISIMQRNTTGKWFISFYIRLKSVEEQQSGKFFRIYGDVASIYLSAGAGNLYLRGFSECGTMCSPEPRTVWSSPGQFRGETWHRVDIEMSQIPDMFSVYLDSKLQFTKSSLLPSMKMQYTGDQKQQWVSNVFNGDGHTLGVGGMIDAGHENGGFPANGSYRFDDIFADYTLARVELCDTATWVNCTRKEIQIPQKWSDSSITLKANPGAFAAGQTAYLYFVNQSGEATPVGFPVVIGATGSATPPSIPTPTAAPTSPTPAPTGSTTQTVTSFTLINADTNLPVPGFERLVSGSTLDRAKLPPNLNIRANTSPAIVGSVKLVLKSAIRTDTIVETATPYALYGDINGDYKAGVFGLASYTLTGMPYSAGAAGGTAGQSLVINFTVFNSGVSP